VILPVWHNVTKEDVLKYSPPLANLYAAQSSKGLNQVVNELIEAICPGNRPDSVGSEYNLKEVLLIQPINGMGQNIYFWDSYTWEKRSRGEPLYEHGDPDFFVRIHLLLKALTDMDIIKFDFHYLPYRFIERPFSRKLYIDSQLFKYDTLDLLIKRIALKRGEVRDVRMTKKYIVSLDGPHPVAYGELRICLGINVHAFPKLASYSLQYKLEPGGELKFLKEII